MVTPAVTSAIMFDLPEPWTVVSRTEWDRFAHLPNAGSTLSSVAEIVGDIGLPDLVANLAQPVVDDAGTPVAVIIATCAAYAFADQQLASALPDEQIRLVADVEIAEGIPAEFIEAVFAVRGERGCAVLMFSTPNLPLRAEMEDLFRSIVQTVRFVETDA